MSSFGRHGVLQRCASKPQNLPTGGLPRAVERAAFDEGESGSYNYIVSRYKQRTLTSADRKFIAQAEFRYQIRRFLHFSEETARRAGIHPQQYQLLLAIRGLPRGQEARIGNLAERLQLEHHSAVELINRAERRGLVMRAGDHNDRRQVIVHLTSSGETLLKKLAHRHRVEIKSVTPYMVKALQVLAKTEKTGGKQAK